MNNYSQRPSTFIRIGSIILTLVLLTVYIFGYLEAVHAKRLAAQSDMSLSNSGRSNSVRETRQINALVLANPLDQGLVNLMYVDRLRTTDTAPRRLITALADLGWRNTAAQQNLILQAVGEKDLDTIIRRTDGLMRRSVHVEPGLNMLQFVELYPKSQPILVERLGAQPTWRDRFFDQAIDLDNRALITARARTLLRIVTSKGELSRREAWLSLRTLGQAGLFEEALTISNYVISKENQQKNREIADPDFKQLGARLSRAQPVLPFEWEIPKTRGVSVNTHQSAAGNEVTLRWNGRGAPVLMQKLTDIQPDTLAVLKIRGDTNAGSLDQNIRVILKCGDGSSVTFTPENKISPTIDKLWQANGPTPCRFANLQILGRPRDIARSIIIDLNRIEFLKA